MEVIQVIAIFGLDYGSASTSNILDESQRDNSNFYFDGDSMQESQGKHSEQISQDAEMTQNSEENWEIENMVHFDTSYGQNND